MRAGESLESSPNSERHSRNTERATAALEVWKVTPFSSQIPAASTRPASSGRYVRREPEAVPAASWRRTSEANEGSLAHLLRQAEGVVPDAGADLVREEIRLPQP